MSNPYEIAPNCILTRLTESNESLESYCAGFELSEWRCSGLADNLIEWIIDYALKSDELRDTNHTNTFVRLKRAASRVYTSENMNGVARWARLLLTPFAGPISIQYPSRLELTI